MEASVHTCHVGHTPIGPPTLDVGSDSAHVGLEIAADGGEEVVVCVEVADDLVAVVEVVGARMVGIVDGGLQQGGERERERESREKERGKRWFTSLHGPLSLPLSVCLSVCLYVCLYVCLASLTSR